jgi:hypothetical protein
MFCRKNGTPPGKWQGREAAWFVAAIVDEEQVFANA